MAGDSNEWYDLRGIRHHDKHTHTLLSHTVDRLFAKTYSFLSINAAGLGQLCLMFLVTDVFENKRIFSLNNHLDQHNEN